MRQHECAVSGSQTRCHAIDEMSLNPTPHHHTSVHDTECCNMQARYCCCRSSTNCCCRRFCQAYSAAALRQLPGAKALLKLLPGAKAVSPPPPPPPGADGLRCVVPRTGAEPDTPCDSPATASTDREYTTRRLLRHYGNYASAAAKCARPPCLQREATPGTSHRLREF